MQTKEKKIVNTTKLELVIKLAELNTLISLTKLFQVTAFTLISFVWFTTVVWNTGSLIR
jgi:hypothetical protein